MNPKNVSSLTSSYLLKVAKFLVKFSQFEFLVMTEKNIFVYKFFVIKYFRFWFIFYVKIATPLPKKGHSPLSQQPPLKIVLSSPLFGNLVGGSSPSPLQQKRT